ncbi:MAG: tryptophan-rich sensory protein [Eubacteriales bacterium]
MKDTKRRILGIMNFLAFIMVVTINALANILPIAGVNTGEVSDAYPNLFAPAGITFSIWGVIYFLLLLFVLYSLGAFGKKGGFEAAKRASIPFIISSLANTAWIFSWHYQIIPLSLALMVTILVFLMIGYVRIQKLNLSTAEKIFVRLPFSVYFGWITVAAIANVTTFLVDIGWNGFGVNETIWMGVALVAALVIGAATTLRFRDWAYGLVILWAFAGIYIKHISPNGFDSGYPLVIYTVSAAIALQLAAEISLFLHKKV